MAEGKTPKMEVPPELRAMTERGVEQAKAAFDSSMQSAQQALSAFDQWFKTSQAGAHDIGSKAMTFAQRNVQSAFEYAQTIVQAKNLEEVVKKQTEFVQSQLRALSEQAKELSDTATKMTSDGAKELGQSAKAAMEKLKTLADGIRTPKG